MRNKSVPGVEPSRSKHVVTQSNAAICQAGFPAIETKWRTCSSTVFRNFWSRLSSGESSSGWVVSSFSTSSSTPWRPSSGQSRISSATRFSSHSLASKSAMRSVIKPSSDDISASELEEESNWFTEIKTSWKLSSSLSSWTHYFSWSTSKPL